MKLHGNAALSWSGRRRLAVRVVEQGWPLAAAAARAGVSVRCARKWAARYRVEGERGLHDRSSAPRCVANRTPSERVEVILALRRLRMTAAEIAELLGMALSTVSGILTRFGVGRLGLLGRERPLRYERSRPGELVHVDVKRLGRIQGGAGWRVRGGPQHYNRTSIDRDGRRRNTVAWEYVHIAVDDYSRLAYAEVLPAREGEHRDRLPASRRCLLLPLRHRDRTAPDGQRLRLPRNHPRARLSPPRHQAPAYASPPATDEREGGALRAHPAFRLGVRSHLPLERGTYERP